MSGNHTVVAGTVKMCNENNNSFAHDLFLHPYTMGKVS